jgi:signal transduction histidine kinase
MRELSLKKKLTFSFFLISAVILILAVITFTQIMERSLTDRAFRQLVAIRSLKKTRIVNYLHTLHRQSMFLATESMPDELSLEDKNWFKEFQSKLAKAELGRELVDVLIFKNGKVLHSLTGNQSLPRAISEKLSQNTLSDSYIEFDLDDRKSGQDYMDLGLAFELNPEQSKDSSYVVFVFSSRRVADILKERYGMGETGESYIVGAKDHLLRSDSRFLDPKRSVKSLKIYTESVQKALNEGAGVLIAKDYRGIKVYNSFDRIRLGDLDWVILSKIDLEEVLEPLKQVYTVFGVAAAIGFILAYLVSSWFAEKISKKELKQRNLRRLSLYQGQETERERVSKELHDSVGQMLAGALYKIESLQAQSSPQSQRELKGLIQEVIGEISRISYDLAPRVLMSFGLIPAIKQLCELSTSSSRVQFEFQYVSEQANRRFSPTIERNLFRVVQEAVHNVCKHSQATRCAISFEVSEESPSALLLSIQDNGIGLIEEKVESREAQGSNGFKNIRERVESLGGYFEIHSHLNGGTELEIGVPAVSDALLGVGLEAGIQAELGVKKS